MTTRDGELAAMMQQKEEYEARKSTDKEQLAMIATPTGEALLLVHRVLYLNLFFQSSMHQNLGVASKVTTLATESIFFFADSLLRLEAVFRVAGKIPLSTQVISGLWDVFSTTFFLVPHFVMLIVNKLIAYCLFLYTIASISLQCLCFYFQLSQASFKIMRILEHKD